MDQNPESIHQRLKTPRAAAVAGIIFSLLLIASQLLIRTSIPANPLAPAADVIAHAKTISLALNLLPFAGIAFLWFIGVVRDRLGELEDRFFSTVFLGSGLLFIAMTFTAATVAGGVVRILGIGPENLAGPSAYALGRLTISQLHVYAVKMSAVFMTSLCTISLRTRIAPRWMAFLGLALATLLLLSGGTNVWTPAVFPLWVFLLSVHILIENLRGHLPPARPDAQVPGRS